MHKVFPMLYYIMPDLNALACKPKSPFSERGALACEGGVCVIRTNPAKIPLLYGGVPPQGARWLNRFPEKPKNLKTKITQKTYTRRHAILLL